MYQSKRNDAAQGKRLKDVIFPRKLIRWFFEIGNTYSIRLFDLLCITINSFVHVDPRTQKGFCNKRPCYGNIPSVLTSLKAILFLLSLPSVGIDKSEGHIVFVIVT